MKGILCFIFVGLLVAVSAPAQNKHLPFQGKLYENGQAFSGQKTFTFSINNGGVNWTETHPGVQVNGGLYSVTLGTISPLPTNLFKNQGMHQLSILVEGNPLDIVDIYAPVENDPTVPDNVKDGVSWTELSGIPAGIDLDNTNELQVLSVSGDTLFISGGNYVVLPAGDFAIGDFFQVGQYDTINQPDVGQLSGTFLHTSSTIWQSFQPTASGNITSIELDFNNNDSNGQIYVRIRPGEGTSQQSLNQWIFSASAYPTQASPIFQIFELADALPVIVGNKYTFEITKVSSGDQNLTFGTDGAANSYLNGRSSIDPSTDLKFIIHMDLTSEPNFIVHPEGTIETPSGRIKDKTGYVAFPGEIRMFAGPEENIPEGWLLCDGDLIDKNEYNELFVVLGNAWGDGNGDLSKFRLPDLRGTFVRGVDSGSGKDPDSGNRQSRYSGGNAGNNIGSFQESVFKSHKHSINHDHPSAAGVHKHDLGDGLGINSLYGHDYYLPGSSPKDSNDIVFSILSSGKGQRMQAKAEGVDLPNFEDFSGNVGGSESRPYNAYVYYIIKY